MATCPVCGKKHLSISKANGLFHCFTPGCDFKGQADDFKPYAYQHNALGVRNCDSDVNVSVKRKRTADSGKGATIDAADDFLPEDYEQLAPGVLQTLKPIESDSAVCDYLKSVGIPVEVAAAAGCMAAVRVFNNVQHHCLAYVNRVFGSVINVKYRAVDGKLFSQDAQKAKDAPSAPYNIDCINPLNIESEPDLLIITEGEKDCLTLLAAGYESVISIPNGAGNKPEVCFAPFLPWLATVRRIVVCGDSDKAGRVMKRNLRAFFGKMNIATAVAQMPMGCKDISEVNMAYGMDEVRCAIDRVEWPTCTDIVRITDDIEGICDVLAGNYDHGYSIGYGPLTDEHLKLTDEGGLIVVTGRPNSGKTDWVRSTMVRLMVKQRKRVCFLSFEEPNKRKHVRRVVELTFGTRRTETIPKNVLDEALAKLNDLMVNLRITSMAPSVENIIRLCDRLRKEYSFPMDFLCIDPYLFIATEGGQETETLQIKEVLTALQSWGRDNGIWVLMVAHPRKLVKDGTGEYEDVDEYTISGSAHWANLADYLLSVKRVFPGGMTDQGSKAPSFTIVNVLKVRDQELCHTGRLYYLRQPNGRYEERDGESKCKEHLQLPAIPFVDIEGWLEVRG